MAGRIRAIADIELEPIQACHRDFLRNMRVRANLVGSVLSPSELWGLLVAHDCQAPHSWSPLDIELIQQRAKTLATAACIQQG